MMTIEERAESYIESLRRDLPGYLETLAENARSENIPIIRPAMIDFMETMLKLYKPMTILEIGTAIGFSALLMREFAPAGCKITTIENYEPRIRAAEKNFAEYDVTGQIRLIPGDAVEILAAMDTDVKFDMVFMDAAKGQYINMYEDVKRILVPGGLLLSDNVLQEGDILESRYAVRRRDRTIHSRMREFLSQLAHDADYTTSILPIADGIALSVKKYES